LPARAIPFDNYHRATPKNGDWLHRPKPHNSANRAALSVGAWTVLPVPVFLALLDYIMPVFYAVLVVRCRREQRWFGPGLWAPGRLEVLWVFLAHAITLWRTTSLHKWDWVVGRPW
jgi:hypothetical protein